MRLKEHTGTGEDGDEAQHTGESWTVVGSWVVCERAGLRACRGRSSSRCRAR